VCAGAASNYCQQQQPVTSTSDCGQQLQPQQQPMTADSNCDQKVATVASNGNLFWHLPTNKFPLHSNVTLKMSMKSRAVGGSLQNKILTEISL
jgi:hypothetical protein